jgi:hypothetical protein
MSLAAALEKYTPQGVPDSAIVKLTPSGSYSTGGDTFSIAPGSWTDPNGKGIINYPDSGVIPSVDPVVVGNVGLTSTSEGAYAVVVPGTTQSTYKLQIFAPGGTEISAGAYAAGILSGYFLVQVYF